MDIPTAPSVSTGVVEDVPLPEVMVEVGGPSEAADAVLMNEPSSLGPVGVPSSAEERAKGIVEDGYEIDFDIDPEEVRRFNERFTRVEVRLEGFSHTIVIPIDRDLLVNTEDAVPSLGPLCSNTEDRTLATFNDAALSSGIAGLALRVCFFDLPNICALYLSLSLSLSFRLTFSLLLLFYRSLSWRFRVLTMRRAVGLLLRRWKESTTSIATSTARSVGGLVRVVISKLSKTS